MDDLFSLQAYDYFLPESQIAQQPAKSRDGSRLMVLDRKKGETSHLLFNDLPSLIEPGDCLVMNNTRVFPARLTGHRDTGGKVELFLLHFPEQALSIQDNGPWAMATAKVLTRSSKPLRPGQNINIGQALKVEIMKRNEDGSAEIALHYKGRLTTILEEYGQTPLPPYIKRKTKASSDSSRYQTVYARETGSVAAPTAGLHFTEEVLDLMAEQGVKIAEITLHVGYGTFAPVRTEDIRRHKIHSEYAVVPERACQTINATKREGGKIIAVGTTSVRSIEWAADQDGMVQPRSGECSLYIMPDFEFKTIDCMLTNFHLPRSSLLILVSAFAGRDRILTAYEEAVTKGYRFYSYGDAMFII